MKKWKETEFGTIPKEWNVKTIGEIKSSDKSAIAMGPFGSNIKAENFVPSGIPVIRGTNLNYDKYVAGDFVYLTPEKANELKGSNCKEGDLVFTHRGTIGQVGLIPQGKYDRYVISQSGMKLTVDKEIINPEFLFYFFKSKYGQHQLLKNEAQVGVPSISNPLTSLKAIEIPIPPIVEQNAIAETLSCIDNKINLLQRQNLTLEALAKTIFEHRFTIEGNDLIALGDYVDCVNGYSYKSSELKSSKTALVTLKNFDRKGGFRLDGFKEFVGKVKEQQLVNEGDLVVAHTDITQEAEVIGNPALVIADPNYDAMVITMDLVKVLPKYGWLSIEFLYFLMRSREFKYHCLGCSNGTTVLHLSKKAIPTFEFQKPDKEAVIEFTSQAKTLLKKVLSNHRQLKSLIKLRDTLLPKLMSGEVRLD